MMATQGSMMFSVLLTACSGAPDVEESTPPGYDDSEPIPVESADSDDSADDTGGESAETAPPVADADADGFTTEAGDCDDDDALVHPGATELCDGVDQDCDGETVGPGGCADGVDLSAYPDLPGWIGTVDYCMATTVGVSVGDGEDLLFAQSYAWDSPEDGRVRAQAVFSDLPTGSRLPYADGAADILYPTWPYGTVQPSFPFRDHDGDGLRDLVLASPGGLYDGAVFLVEEPGSSPRVGTFEEASFARWLDPGDEGFAGAVDGSGDLDGDGLAEVLSLSTGYDGVQLEPSRLYVAAGRGLVGTLDPLEETLLIGDALESFGGWRSICSDVRAGPDLDGDGGAEVFLDAGSGGLALASGASLVEADGSSIADIFISLPSNLTGLSPAQQFFSPGDWDGDGRGDLAWTDVTDTHCLYIASYGTFGADALVDTLQSLCYGERASLLEVRGDHDLDGDGVRDPIVTLSGYDVVDAGYGASGFVLPSTWLDGGTAEITEVGVRVLLDREKAVGLSTVDLDDDGVPELTSSMTEPEDAPYDLAGLIQVLPGFALPFDDPSRW